MKTQRNSKQNCRRDARRASVLVGAVIVSAVLFVTVGSFLTYLNHEYYVNYRSLHWTQALQLAEAGVEEGFYELNFRYCQGTGFLSGNGWQAIGGGVAPLTTLSGGDTGYSRTVTGVTASDGTVIGNYTVQVINPAGANPYILAKGTIANNPYGINVSRLAKVITSQSALFNFAFFAKNKIDLNGNGVDTDSYISSDPNYSTSGKYDSGKKRDHGDVATNLAVIDSISVGNANIWGAAGTGPGGSISIGPNGNVGPFGTPSGTVADGYFRDDVQVDIPPAALPTDFNVGTAVNKGNINNNTTLTGGDYIASGIDLKSSDKLTFNGTVRIYVTGNVTMGGNSQMVEMSGSNVQIYTAGASVKIAGNGILNSAGPPSTLRIYGLPTTTSMDISGNGIFSGVVYAPSADVKLNGGGSNGDVSGAIVANTITLNGHVQIHYDEALKNAGPSSGYRAKSWEELVVSQ